LNSPQQIPDPWLQGDAPGPAAASDALPAMWARHGRPGAAMAFCNLCFGPVSYVTIGFPVTSVIDSPKISCFMSAASPTADRYVLCSNRIGCDGSARKSAEFVYGVTILPSHIGQAVADRPGDASW